MWKEHIFILVNSKIALNIYPLGHFNVNFRLFFSGYIITITVTTCQLLNCCFLSLNCFNDINYLCKKIFNLLQLIFSN